MYVVDAIQCWSGTCLPLVRRKGHVVVAGQVCGRRPVTDCCTGCRPCGRVIHAESQRTSAVSFQLRYWLLRLFVFVCKFMAQIGIFSIPSVLWHYWLGDRKDIWPATNFAPAISENLGYWLRRGMATIPQDNEELLVVRDKVGRPQVSLG